MTFGVSQPIKKMNKLETVKQFNIMRGQRRTNGKTNKINIEYCKKNEDILYNYLYFD